MASSSRATCTKPNTLTLRNEHLNNTPLNINTEKKQTDDPFKGIKNPTNTDIYNAIIDMHKATFLAKNMIPQKHY